MATERGYCSVYGFLYVPRLVLFRKLQIQKKTSGTNIFSSFIFHIVKLTISWEILYNKAQQYGWAFLNSLCDKIRFA
jgi:hypothetical protein